MSFETYRIQNLLLTLVTVILHTGFYSFFPISGTSSSTGKFSALSAVIASNEDTEGWSSIYRYVESLDIAPKYHLADGAKAITKAIDNVFGLQNCTRLMCWPHVYRNIVPKLKPISSINKALADQLLLEIENLQWSVHNEQSFLSVFNLLEMKYLDNDDSDLTAALERFFSYMKEVWVESREFRWYEGANPWSVSNNQGVEGKNKEIKQSHTFRQRLDMGSLFTVMLNMVEEWAEEDDILLTSSRLATLHGQPNSLSLKTAGFQWLKANELRPGRILQINAGGKYTMSESLEFMLGKVDSIWAVSSQSDSSGKSLKELAKTRLANRELPTSPSFDAYLKMRSGCWIIEERDGDFFCDCPVGMKVKKYFHIYHIFTYLFKGKLCKHTVGMLYKAGLLVASPDVRSVPLGAKRKRGRPKRLPNCLARSPVGAPLPAERQDDSEEEVALIEADSELEVVELGVKTSKRKQPGLGYPKPPKKRAKLPIEPTLLSTLAGNQPPAEHSKNAKTKKDPKPLNKRANLHGAALPAAPVAAPNPGPPPKSPKLPPAIKCKKWKDSCNHKTAFGKHYDKSLFDIYEANVKSKTSTVVIDPDYVP